jgi:Tfp pilus assembly protein PilV
MKQNGFMMLETMIAMTFMAFIAMFTVQLVMNNLQYIDKMKSNYYMLQEVKKRLTLTLINPNSKQHYPLLFQNNDLTFKTNTREIESKSSLKPFRSTLKIRTVSGHKLTEKDNPTTLMALILASPKKAEI